MPITVRDMIKRIEADGWVLDRRWGSHRQYKHPVKKGLVTIPGHPSTTLKPGTESTIKKQAGL